MSREEYAMATAKHKKKTVPPDFTIDEGTPKKRIPFLEDDTPATGPVAEQDSLDDPDKGLAKEFTDHVSYDTPISAELQAIIDDPVRCARFCEETALDPEMVEQYRREK
jgi:hypothetical protein